LSSPRLGNAHACFRPGQNSCWLPRKSLSARHLAGTPTIGLGGRTGAQQARLYLAAIDERDRRIEDHALASFQSGNYFHLRSQVARDPDVADLSFAVLDHSRLQAVAVEEQSLRRNGEGRRLARYREFNLAVDAGR
jgi:hypothetical protein